MGKTNKKKCSRRVAVVAVGLSLAGLAVLGPLLVRVPPIEDAVPPEELADEESRFAEINGVQVHYKLAGKGKRVFILLHGFGASVFTWREVMPELAKLGTVIAFDRPAFGLTERPFEWRDGRNPYSPEAQVTICVGLLDMIGADKAVLVGNSAGGTVALTAALRHPQRVEALVLADPAIYTGGGAPRWIRPLLATPQMRRLGPLLVRQLFTRGERLVKLAWHDASKVTPEIMAGYAKPLRSENWDRALWEMTLASSSAHSLAKRLGEVRMPALVITGDNDRIVPTAQSVRLAGELPSATLEVIPSCGHVPQEECPQEFMRAVEEFLGRLSPPEGITNHQR